MKRPTVKTSRGQLDESDRRGAPQGKTEDPNQAAFCASMSGTAIAVAVPPDSDSCL
jgi:hypothetical protein